MRKNLFLSLLVFLLLMVSCGAEKKGKYSDIPLTQIDSTTLNPDLKKLVRDYLKIHPKYHSLLMLEPHFIPDDMRDEYNGLVYRMIGPALKELYTNGEFGVRPPYPASYFIVDDCIVFVQSITDNLTLNVNASKVYDQYAEPLDTFRSESGEPYVYPLKDYFVKSWGIAMKPLFAPSLVTTRCDTFFIKIESKFIPPEI